MTPDKMTLPLSPHDFWLGAGIIAFILLSLLVFLVLNQMAKPERPQLWDDLPANWRLLIVLLGMLWLALFGLTLWAAFAGVLQTISPKDATSQPSLGFGTLLVALLGAPFLIWTTALKHQTVRYQKEGHMTDRINKAVEQLGAEKTVKVRAKDTKGKDITIEETQPNIEVRIGAILSLERIAQDSTRYDNGRDHVRVMEILCAYVRENAPASSAKDGLRQIWEQEKVSNWNSLGLTEEQFMEKHGLAPDMFDHVISIDGMREWAQAMPKPRIDVMQCIQVIGRRTSQQRRVEAAWPKAPDDTAVWPFEVHCPSFPTILDNSGVSKSLLDQFQGKLEAWQTSLISYQGYRLNLSSVNLQGANLSSTRPDSSDAVFSGALFSNTRMEGANIEAVRLEGADLKGARIDGSQASEANFSGADLSKSSMQGTVLYAAQMQGVYALAVRMEGSDLTEVRMEGAMLRRSRMERVRLDDARLEVANLEGARLDGGLLRSTKMSGANLKRARLNEVELDETQMEWVKLDGSQMLKTSAKNVDLSMTSIDQEQLNEMFADSTVVIIDKLVRPTHWPTWDLPDWADPAFVDELGKWRADPATYTPPPPP